MTTPIFTSATCNGGTLKNTRLSYAYEELEDKTNMKHDQELREISQAPSLGLFFVQALLMVAVAVLTGFAIAG